MAAVYTIRIVDQASAAAARVQMALSRVAVTAAATASAMSIGGKAEQAFARDAERLARAQLKAANAVMRAGKAADALGKKRLPRALGGAGDAFGAFRASVSGATAFVASAVTGMAYRVGRDLLETAGRAQQLERTFERIAPGELASTRALVQKLGLDLEEGEKAALKLRTTFDQFTARKFLEFFRAVNLSPGELDRATLAITQIQGRGKLQAEELNQFVEAVPGVDRGKVVDQISKEMGIARDLAAKRLQTGQVPADVGIRSLVFATLDSRKMLDPTDARGFGGMNSAIEQSSGDILVRLAAFDNAITSLKRNLGTGLAASGVLGDLAKLTENLERLSRIDFSRFFEGIRKVRDFFQEIQPGTILFRFFSGDDSTAAGKAGAAIGNAIGAGAAVGIANSQSQAETAMKNMASGVITTGNDAFGIHSPSRVMKDTGADVAAGLAIGVDDHADLAFSSAEAMAEGTVAEAEMAAATGSGPSAAHMANVGAAAGNAFAGGPSGGSSAQVSVAITVDGASGPAATVDAIRDFFATGEFASILERQLEGSGA